jgi:hypothetical protein
MPFVKPKIADHLLNVAEKFETVVPMWPNGMIETLIMVLQRSKGQEILQTLCQLKRARPSDIPRATPKTLLVSPLKTIKTLDPNLKSFININTQEDLKKLQTRDLQGPIQKNVQINRGCFLFSDLQLMHEASQLLQEGNFIMAQEKFDLCESRFEGVDNFFWAALASECKGEALLRYVQLQKEANSQVILDLEFKCREAFSRAINNYHSEAKFYEENHCIRLLERVNADKQLCTHFVNDCT